MFNNGPSIVTTGLDLLVDAADQQSYPGTGTVWRDLRSGTTGSFTGSVSFTSEFYGGLTFSNSSSAVIFPGSTANYGTGSFTVEMAFKPTFINGRHYLMSKNSGSFPNWSIFLSGSNGSGKLFSQFNITAAVSCSVTSSTVFETGSVYQVDVRVLPGISASGIYVNGQSEGGVFGNGGGSLTTTGSLFVGNFSQNNTQNFSGSIYTIKTYLQASTEQPVINYNATATRLGKAPAPYVAPVFELLVVAGGGGSQGNTAGGGGGGGLVYSSFNPIVGASTVIVGSGSTGNNGTNSIFSSVVAIGGGRGIVSGNGASGGSGGGGGGYNIRTGGAGTSGQGFQGGNNINNAGTDVGAYNGSAAGGGAGGTGSNATNSYTGAPGGPGRYISSFAAIGGSPAGWFAGGGGGGDIYFYNANYGRFQGGIGGGGTGSTGNPIDASSFPPTVATPGITNTGGGAGGTGASGTGAAGGSGIVAIRYNGAPIAIGGEITQSAGFTYHVYRTVGTSSFTIF